MTTEFIANEIWNLACASLAAFFVLGHNLWLVAKNDPKFIRVEANTSDDFPLSDSAVKPERVSDFRIVSAQDGDAPIADYRVEENSLVADVNSNGNSFYGAVSLHPHPITLEAERFARYVADEEAENFVSRSFAAGQTDQPQRERYANFAKVFIKANPSDDAIALVVGHKLEIVPQTALRVGEIVVRVLFEGKPISGLRVSSGGENINNGKYLVHTRTDENGLAKLEIGNSGHWFVRTHFIRPHEDRENFEWESFWASLVFRI